MPGSTDTHILGFPVLPIDPTTLPDKNVLTWVRSARNIQFLATGTGGTAVTSLNALTGALSIVAGSGITVTVGASTITIAATVGATPNFADDETPTGSRPGTSFTLAHTPSPAGSLLLFWNGALQKPGGVDYTLAGNAITTVNTIGAGDSFLAWYRY